MPDYNLLGSQDVLEELQEGRTRELLLLLQDKPVPEVIDPVNIQNGLSYNVTQDGDGDYISAGEGQSTATRDADNSFGNFADKNGIKISLNQTIDQLSAKVSSNTSTGETAFLETTDRTILAEKDISGLSDGDTITFDMVLPDTQDYYLLMDSTTTVGSNDNPSFPYESSTVDIVAGFEEGVETTSRASNFNDVAGSFGPGGYVTDSFTSPTTSPANFKAWNAIRAEGVTTGGSTSVDPVEFDILDSTDTVLTSSRIPVSEIADSAFKLRDRDFSTTAGSDGQANYQIPETGSGGHYGLPVLSVVTVEQNGSVLDPSGWEFDGTDTVTIDTSTVSIMSGDSITISYDFDVFDSTLQPRAYLSRESGTETSPSISHFRYEYVI